MALHAQHRDELSCYGKGPALMMQSCPELSAQHEEVRTEREKLDDP